MSNPRSQDLESDPRKGTMMSVHIFPRYGDDLNV